VPATTPRRTTGCISNQLLRRRESAQKLVLAVLGPSKGAYTSSESYLDNGSSGFRSRRAAHYVSYPYLLFEEAEHEEGPESLQRVCKRRGMRSAAEVTL
jgi:hypothetical protein